MSPDPKLLHPGKSLICWPVQRPCLPASVQTAPLFVEECTPLGMDQLIAGFSGAHPLIGVIYVHFQ